MYRRWLCLFMVVAALIVVAGCGRVNLEDLTPEAFKTAQANLPTPTARPTQSGTPGADGSPGAGGGVQGNAQNGKVLYGTWCTGCHDTGRLNAPPIKGKAYDPATITPALRGDAGATLKHPATYKVTELNDKQIQDILAYIATAQ